MSKPRPPKVNKENLRKAKSQTSPITKLKSRFELLEELKEKIKLPTSYIALEAFCELYGGRQEGFRDEELREAWPKDWGNETITIPAVLVQALTSAWIDYKEAPSGKTFGESFKLEGGGQGKPKVKDIVKMITKNRVLTNEVMINYLSGDEKGQPISIEKAIANVHGSKQEKMRGFSEVTAKKAYTRGKKDLFKKLKDKGIL